MAFVNKLVFIVFVSCLSAAVSSKDGLQEKVLSSSATIMEAASVQTSSHRPGSQGNESLDGSEGLKRSLQENATIGGAANVQPIPFMKAATADLMAYDGYFHNLEHPEWGRIESILHRRLPHGFKDGVREPGGWDRPNPRTLSLELMSGPSGRPSFRNRTAMMVYYGQHLVEEILDSQVPHCPLEYFNIPIPKCDALYDPNCTGKVEIPLPRARYNSRTGVGPSNPREIINEITPWLDGGLVYGTSKAWTDKLRSFEGGRLMEGKPGYPPLNDPGLPMFNPPPPLEHHTKPSSRLYRLGNPRGHENPYLTAMQIVWFRLHNYYADNLLAKFSGWSDEQLFQRARQIVVAIHQRVTLYEFLPAFLGVGVVMPPYEGYKPSIFPAIPVEFQSAAMRFGHTLVTPGLVLRNSTCGARSLNKKAHPDTVLSGKHGIRTCNSYWESSTILAHVPVEEVLMGMASQKCEAEDNTIVEDLRGFVFGPLEFSRRDLMAINIQRGRETGLPDFNTARRAYGLTPYTNFSDIVKGLEGIDEDGMTPTRVRIAAALERLYEGNIDNIDLFVGGILETTRNGPGELFSAIIKETFLALRDGDRWWYENPLNGLFNKEEMAYINATRFSDVLRRADTFQLINTSIQDFVFTHGPDDPCPTPQPSAEDFAPCTPFATYHYWPYGRYPLLLTLLAASLIGLAIALFYFLAFGGRVRLQGLGLGRPRQPPAAFRSRVFEGRPLRERERASLGADQSSAGWNAREGGGQPKGKEGGPLRMAFVELSTAHSSLSFRMMGGAHYTVLGFTRWMSGTTHMLEGGHLADGDHKVLHPRGLTVVSVAEFTGAEVLGANVWKPSRFLQLREVTHEHSGRPFPVLAVLGARMNDENEETVLYAERLIPLLFIEAITHEARRDILWIQVRVGHDLMVSSDRALEILEDLQQGITVAHEAANGAAVTPTPRGLRSGARRVGMGLPRTISDDSLAGLDEEAAAAAAPGRHQRGGDDLYTPLVGFSEDVVAEAFGSKGGSLGARVFKTEEARAEEVHKICRCIVERVIACAKGSGKLQPDENGAIDMEQAVIARTELAHAFKRQTNSYFVRNTCDLASQLDSTGLLPPGYLCAEDVVWPLRVFYAKDEAEKDAILNSRLAASAQDRSMEVAAEKVVSKPQLSHLLTRSGLLTRNLSGKLSASGLLSRSGRLAAAPSPLARSPLANLGATLLRERLMSTIASVDFDGDGGGQVEVVAVDCTSRRTPSVSIQVWPDDTVLSTKEIVYLALGVGTGAADDVSTAELVLVTADAPLRVLADERLLSDYGVTAGTELQVCLRADLEAQLKQNPAAAKLVKPTRAGLNDADSDTEDNEGEELDITNASERRRFLGVDWETLSLHVVENRLFLSWVTLYFALMMGIIAERFVYYSLEREVGGLRFITGLGVSVTRAAASGISINMALTMLFVSNHVLTYLRETWIRLVFPIDHALFFHKLTGIGFLFFSAMHTIGHCFNFYNIGTQPSFDISCYLREIFLYSDEVTSFFMFWGISVTTGWTGVVLVIVLIPFAIFSLLPRQAHYKAFQYTHDLFLPVYLLTFIHGLGMLVQYPIFHWFFAGPGVPTGSCLYLINWIVGKSLSLQSVRVLKARHLPGKVLNLVLEKPRGFNFKAAQYIRIKVPQIDHNNPHPFTLSSAPDDEAISVHIRAVGPWTNKIYQLYDPAHYEVSNAPDAAPQYPPVYIDGPFGEIHTGWTEADSLVLVAGGIGVTPAASILRGILFDIYRAEGQRAMDNMDLMGGDAGGDASSGSAEDEACAVAPSGVLDKALYEEMMTNSRRPRKQVFFYWVSKQQDQFEWFMDVLQELEEKAAASSFVELEMAVFVTQPDADDLRTQLGLLDHDELRESDTDRPSFYTGLRTRTYFRRPNWNKILGSLRARSLARDSGPHPFRVCACAPKALCDSLRAACTSASDNNVSFQFLQENF